MACTRRSTLLMFSLALLSGVMALPARAQQFHVERDFDFRRSPAYGDAPLRNKFWVSLPYDAWIADVANSSAPGYPNRCVGEVAAPAMPDGEINVDDLICAWWTARHDPGSEGIFLVTMYDHATCSSRSRAATMRLGQPFFWGSLFPEPCIGAPPPPGCGQIRTDIGYEVIVGTTGPGHDPRNHAVIEGDHDPGFPGHMVVASPACGMLSARHDVIAVPYNTAYTRPIEILCGQEGVDWIDANGDHLPDNPADCSEGLFDGFHTIAIQALLVGDPALGGTNGYAQLLFVTNGFGQPRIEVQRPGYELIAGEAYDICMTAQQLPEVFLSPVD